MTIGKKLNFTTANDIKKKYKLTMDLTPNDWKHLLKTESS